MRKAELTKELIELIENLGITIRKEKGLFTEGLCKLNDKKIILINKISNEDRVIHILIQSLLTIDLENLYIKPVVRELIDREKQRGINFASQGNEL